MIPYNAIQADNANRCIYGISLWANLPSTISWAETTAALSHTAAFTDTPQSPDGTPLVDWVLFTSIIDYYEILTKRWPIDRIHQLAQPRSVRQRSQRASQTQERIEKAIRTLPYCIYSAVLCFNNPSNNSSTHTTGKTKKKLLNSLFILLVFFSNHRNHKSWPTREWMRSLALKNEEESESERLSANQHIYQQKDLGLPVLFVGDTAPRCNQSPCRPYECSRWHLIATDCKAIRVMAGEWMKVDSGLVLR